MVFPFALAYHTCMLSPERTVRQRMIELLAETRLSAYQLAQLLGISERQVEDHLPHIVKSLARDRSRRFVLDPSACSDCGFVFRDRTKLTRPSRCPTCRSEAVSAPRYGIDSKKRGSERLDSRSSSG
jgi:predicted Zn-ribbon and HTH transcriptional regulator